MIFQLDSEVQLQGGLN